MLFQFGIPMILMLIFSLPLLFGQLIDPRYPDYIVEPLVPCEDDGYFVHPRNCSWFYRCHSNENITGYYRRDYFECAPGTVFSQERSICDVGSSENCGEPGPIPKPNPTTDCDSCEIANVNVEDGLCNFFELCPDLHNKTLKFGVKLCPNPKYGCEKCTHLNACKDGEWLLVASEGSRRASYRYSFPIQCHPSPYLPQLQCPVTLPPANECGNCRNTLLNCHVYSVCPDGVISVNVTLCASAEKVCEYCPTQKLCPDGEYFENFEQTCYPSPDSPPMQCPDSTSPVECSNCSVRTDFCNQIEICSNGGSPVSKKFCALAVKECTTCDHKEVVCPEVGSFFVEDDQNCQSLPIPSEWQCPTTELPSMTTTTEQNEESTTTIVPTEETTLSCHGCVIITNGCGKNSKVCPDGIKEVDLTLCAKATKVCASCPDQKMCEPGQHYATEDGRCYSEQSLHCSRSTTPIPTSVVTTEPPCSNCFLDTVRCKPLTVCPFGEPATKMRLCNSATRVCDPCKSKEDLCRDGEFYSMERASCFPNPNSKEMQCSPPVVLRDVIVNKPALTPKKIPVVQCSGKNLLPQDQWIKEKFCKNYQSCFRGTGKPTGIIELCTNYFECIYDVIAQDWNLVRSHCPESKLFSYEAESCVSEPLDICRVF